ncbi:MAG TPA: VWA domain-containing protein [Myxococcota bacterium]|jgi:hypothetical protein|nr:VWA domain-containing protein [Myxococcota bacterium]
MRLASRLLRPVALLGALASSLPFAACSRADLQPAVPPPPPGVDNLLEVDGRVCTEIPDDVVFPLKILLIMDTSGSMQCTDDSMYRVMAAQELVDRFGGRAGVEMGIIRFNESIDAADFTPNPLGDTQFLGVLNRLTNADGPTSYQGALAYAYNMLLDDMVDVASGGFSSELPRSKYVIIFFSDGQPDPQCSASMVDPALFCEYARTDWDLIGLDPDDANLWFSYEDGDDYNQPYQILDIVRDIMSLQEQFGVGDIRLHSAFLHPTTYTNPVCPPNWDQLFYIDVPAARQLLTDMATIGNGTFTDYYMAPSITFLNYDYTTIERPFELASFIASNRNAIPSLDHFAVDSDGDGVSDDDEFAYDPDPASPPDPRVSVDFDGDGYGDLFELRNTDRGFDPADMALPTTPCAAAYRMGLGANDDDADGLLNCEEAAMGTEVSLFDTDRDRIDDGLEALFETDPVLIDVDGDIDGDGILNREEILFHSDPWKIDPGVYESLRYWYETTELGRFPDGRTCYDFKIRNITLVTTLARPNPPLDGAGYNDVYLYVTEAPNGDSLDYGSAKLGCVRVRYVAPAFKNPPGGVMELLETDFVDAADFDPDVNCVEPE